MKLANSANIRVFCKEGEDNEAIAGGLKLLLPFDAEKEKARIDEQKAEGFDERQIEILSVMLTKERHLNAFIESLMKRLGGERKTLLEQLGSRLDDDLDFFIRLDKEMLLKGRFVLTDSGNCYHIRISIAAFPKRREKAAEMLRRLLE